MDIITRAEAGLPSPSALSRQTRPWAGITWHHTGGSPTTWKAIHDWQTKGRPAADRLVYCGYSYGIRNGRVTELRGWDYRPAGDHENSRLQVVFMGTFDKALPSAADLAAAQEFARYAEQRAGRRLPGVAHRDVWPAGHRHDTDCPGNALYAWVRDNLIKIGDPVMTFLAPCKIGDSGPHVSFLLYSLWDLHAGLFPDVKPLWPVKDNVPQIPATLDKVAGDAMRVLLDGGDGVHFTPLLAKRLVRKLGALDAKEGPKGDPGLTAEEVRAVAADVVSGAAIVPQPA